MALTTVPLPYGMRDIKVTPYTTLAATTLGTAVDLPYARRLAFSENEEFTELRGDDTIVAIHGSGPSIEWELESGGISFDAVKVIVGGNVTDSGTTPNQKRDFTKLITDQRPYFKAEGQSISDSGGDFHSIIYRAKLNDAFELEQADATFMLTNASGQGLGSLVTADTGKLYSLIQNETITAIA